MNRLTESLRSVLMRERRLGSYEKEVAADGTVSIDVALEKGREYTVRGNAPKGGSFRKIFVTGPGSRTVTVHGGKGMYFSVVPEKEGTYQIRAEIEGARLSNGTVHVVLYAPIDPPAFVVQCASVPMYLADRQDRETDVQRVGAKVRLGEAYGQRA